MKQIILIISLAVVNSCQQTLAPVSDKSSRYGSSPDIHIAGENENLFLVAMRYKLDYQKLGRINGISYPYKLHKGQRVRLNPGTSYRPRPQVKPIKIKPKVITRPQATTSAPEVKTAKQKMVGGIGWQSPLAGKVVKSYAQQPDDYQGIDIAAKPGTNVRAAANGIVVYVGDSLEKYGNLAIVSHKDVYLSAYAHLGKIKVDEGQEVKAGEMVGVTGSANMHFEIRKDADTIDPATILP